MLAVVEIPVHEFISDFYELIDLINKFSLSR